MDAITQFAEWIKGSDNIVFFGGAGVSTESGIPDFRSVDGLYNQKYAFPPEIILSHNFFINYPNEFYRFYRDKLVVKGAEPNAAHLRLASLEKEGKVKAVITQNIDGLHQKAGSRKVLELHGSLLRNYCMKCGKKYPVEAVTDCDEVPYCDCGGVIRPDVVLYEEGLDIDVMNESIKFIQQADVLIVGGTSLSVYPAAGLINYYRGHKLVLINKTPTPMDRVANLLIQDRIGSVFSQV
ncbi:MAG: NAD-dependent protein deacylase [Oscillospiraceae bacterium]|nr:NAD-dependent protein deacylase [Oscillospiraceae bacterium]